LPILESGFYGEPDIANINTDTYYSTYFRGYFRAP